jgi:hypothetical protein
MKSDPPDPVGKELAALAAMPESAIDFSDMPALRADEWKGAVLGRFHRPSGRGLLTRPEFHRLADVPPEAQWLANLASIQTRSAYQGDIQAFMAYLGIQSPEEFRTVARGRAADPTGLSQSAYPYRITDDPNSAATCNLRVDAVRRWRGMVVPFCSKVGWSTQFLVGVACNTKVV